MAAVKLADQIAHVVARGPAAPLRVRAHTLRWLLLYGTLACALLALVGTAAVAWRHDLKRLLFDYLLPGGWHAPAEVLFDRFLAAQAREVLVNATLSGALLLVSAVLFPVKEKLSATFEREADLTSAPGRELPLWMQAWEEGKLVFLYATAQMSILWIGYPPDEDRRALASALSYVYLFGTYGIDFLAPLLQRHGLTYATVLRVLFARPVLTFGFGAVFALPPLLAARALVARPDVEPATLVGVVFAVHLVMLVWAVLAGTRVGAALLPEAQATRVPPWPVRGLVWSGAVGLFAVNAYLFGAVGLAVHHKSQVLKCEWNVDWRSFAFERPSLGGLAFDALVLGDVEVGVRFDVEVRNPTPFDLVFEDNRLELSHDGAPVMTTRLSPMAVRAGATLRQPVGTRLRLKTDAIAKGMELLEDRWAATLFVQVAPGVEFPVYLRARP